MLFHISETSRQAPEAGASTKDNVGGSPSLEDCPLPLPWSSYTKPVLRAAPRLPWCVWRCQGTTARLRSSFWKQLKQWLRSCAPEHWAGLGERRVFGNKNWRNWLRHPGFLLSLPGEISDSEYHFYCIKRMLNVGWHCMIWICKSIST